MKACNQCVNGDLDGVIISVTRSWLPITIWSITVFRKNFFREQYCMDCGEVTWSLKYSFSFDLLLVVYLLSSADSQLSHSATAMFSNSSTDSTSQNLYPDLALFIQEQLWFFCSKSASAEGAFFVMAENVLKRGRWCSWSCIPFPFLLFFSSFPQWFDIHWAIHCVG